MRHLCSLALIAMSSIVALTAGARDARAQAENYNPIRFDSGLTGAYVGSSGRGGFGAMAELKLMAQDHVAVGARFEAAVMFGGSVGQDDVQMDMAGAAAALAKGEYLYGDGPVRPFVGLGLGVFTIASQSLAAGPNTTGIDQKGGRYFGIAPQLGVDLGRLRLAATYNVMLGADIEVHQMIGNVDQTASFSQNYLSFEMSLRFGGGRKHRAPTTVLVPAPVIPAPIAPPPSMPAPIAPAPTAPSAE